MAVEKPQRKASSERKIEIVQAVLKIIHDQGLTSLSTKTISTELGLSSGAIFRHFDSMDEIFRQVVSYGVTRIDETFPEESLPPFDRLKSLITNRYELFQESPGLAWLLKSDQAALTLPQDSLQTLGEMRSKSRTYILTILNEGINNGIFRRDIDTGVLLVLVMGIIHTILGVQGAISGKKENAEGLEKMISGLEKLISASYTGISQK